MIAGVYLTNEEMSSENKHGEQRMYSGYGKYSDLDTHDHVIFQFFFFNKFPKISTFLFFSIQTGCRVNINEK